ncbi:MAG: hypothetical protein ABII74_00335 [Elusimicrobiota bacterium]
MVDDDFLLKYLAELIYLINMHLCCIPTRLGLAPYSYYFSSKYEIDNLLHLKPRDQSENEIKYWQAKNSVYKNTGIELLLRNRFEALVPDLSGLTERDKNFLLNNFFLAGLLHLKDLEQDSLRIDDASKVMDVLLKCFHHISFFDTLKRGLLEKKLESSLPEFSNLSRKDKNIVLKKIFLLEGQTIIQINYSKLDFDLSINVKDIILKIIKGNIKIESLENWIWEAISLEEKILGVVDPESELQPFNGGYYADLSLQNFTEEISLLTTRPGRKKYLNALVKHLAFCKEKKQDHLEPFGIFIKKPVKSQGQIIVLFLGAALLYQVLNTGYIDMFFDQIVSLVGINSWNMLTSEELLPCKRMEFQIGGKGLVAGYL